MSCHLFFESVYAHCNPNKYNNDYFTNMSVCAYMPFICKQKAKPTFKEEM